MKNLTIVILFVLLHAIPAFGQESPGRTGQTVKIGVLAKRGAEKALSQWSATADYLTAEIDGYIFEIAPLDFDEVMPQVEAGQVEFILTNSSMYAELEVLYGASQIVTLKNLRQGQVCTTFGGVIITKKGSDISGLEDLAGRSFAAVKDNSFGGWQCAWREILDAGVNIQRDKEGNYTTDFEGELVFSGKHDDVVMAVLGGEVEAGTIRTDTLEKMENEGTINLSDLKILNEQRHPGFPFVSSTRLYPEWPLARTKQTNEELAEQVAVALINLADDSAAVAAAKIKGWTIAYNYQPVQECLSEIGYGVYAVDPPVPPTLMETIQANMGVFVTAVVFVVLLIMMVGGGTAYVLRQNKRVRTIAGFISIMSDGDFRGEVGPSSHKDELAKMRNQVDTMHRNMRGVVVQLDETAQALATSSAGLRATADESETGTTHLAGIIEKVSKASTEIARQIGEASNMLHETANTVGQVAEDIEQVATFSHEVGDEAQKGGALARQAVDQISAVQSTVKQAADVVRSLEEKTQSIKEFVGEITGIAKQTNLLALNAAIEAARAGDAGRGFAVVADEVRKLADESNMSADKIGVLINETAGEMQLALKAIDLGLVEVEKGSSVVGEAGQTLSKITESIQRVNERITDVSAAAEEMNASIQEVQDTMAKISTETGQSASGMADASSATDEQVSAVREVGSSSGQLEGMAEKLETLVKKFQT